MNKRGQIQISFGMIFSIIIIIATVAVAFYAITYFLDLSKCQQNGLFWTSLQNEIDKAWNSDLTQEIYKADLTSGITRVCFGNFTQTSEIGSRAIFEELKRYERTGRNAYLYPIGKACENLGYYNLKHISTDQFFCVDVKSGKMEVKLSKASTDASVKLSKP